MDKKIAEALARARTKGVAHGNGSQPTVITIDVNPDEFDSAADNLLKNVSGLIVNEPAISKGGVNPDETLRVPYAFKNNGGATKGAVFHSSGKVVLTNLDAAVLEPKPKKNKNVEPPADPQPEAVPA